MKKIAKKIINGSLMLAAVLLFSGCAQGNAEDKIMIGYAINNLNDTFQTFILDAAQEEAKAQGFEVRVENAKEDLITQQDQVNTLIQNGVEALIVVPVDTSAMDPITQAAQDANIPLVYVNRNPFAGREDEMPEGVFYVGSEEITAGIMQIEYIGEKLNGEGGITVLMGILGNEGAVQRTEGVVATAQEKFPNIDILAQETGEWQRDRALTIAENWISTYGEDLNAILANNDEMALGAVQAAINTGRSDILIAGVDAIPDAVEAVANEQLAATVFQDGVGQGSGAIEIIRDVKEDNSPAEAVKYVPFKLVTIDNVSEFK